MPNIVRFNCFEVDLAAGQLLKRGAKIRLHDWLLGFAGFAAPRDTCSTGLFYALRAVEIDNTLAETHALIAQYRAEIEYNWPEVERETRRALELNPASPVVRLRHAVSALLALGRLHAMAAQAYVPPTSFAWIHLGLGETDEAFAWMDKAIDARDHMIAPIKTYWFLDPIRDDPRFAALLRKMNLDQDSGIGTRDSGEADRATP